MRIEAPHIKYAIILPLGTVIAPFDSYNDACHYRKQIKSTDAMIREVCTPATQLLKR